MTRFARARRVFVVEPPLPMRGGRPFVEEHRGPDGLVICVPHVPADAEPGETRAAVAWLLRDLRARRALCTEIGWVERAMDLDLIQALEPLLVVRDRRGEDVDPEPSPIAARRADLVLVSPATTRVPSATRLGAPGRAGGGTGSEARAHVLADAVEAPRGPALVAPHGEPPDQARIPGPRVAVTAPLDPLLDTELLARVALALPDFFFVALGAPTDIDARTLPCRANIHWLGPKSAAERARYVAGWDVAIVPQRERVELPAVALEALASGIPVVATPRRGLDQGHLEPPLFRTAAPADLADALEAALRVPRAELERAAASLRSRLGWDAAFAQVERWISEACERRAGRPAGLALAHRTA